MLHKKIGFQVIFDNKSKFIFWVVQHSHVAYFLTIAAQLHHNFSQLRVTVRSQFPRIVSINPQITNPAITNITDIDNDVNIVLVCINKDVFEI